MGRSAMQPGPMPDLSPPDGDMNAEKPSEDSFSEEADVESCTENLTPGTEGSPIRRYSYSKPV
jgi:hypothetical protein